MAVSPGALNVLVVTNQTLNSTYSTVQLFIAKEKKNLCFNSTFCCVSRYAFIYLQVIRAY